MKTKDKEFEVTISELVNGGQGLGKLPDGRKVFVWNALPGETVSAKLIKDKRSYAEAVALKVLAASPERVEPKDANFLATSPWQILDWQSENRYKKDITIKLLNQHSLEVPEAGIKFSDQMWHYRNKMEYSFWGDESGLHLALHERGSHRKQVVSGSSLANPAIDAVAREICIQLQNANIRAGELKTIIVRCDGSGRVAASLFVKPERFSKLILPAKTHGLRIYHSNPKSPASVATKLLHEIGDVQLHDELLGKPFFYDVDSFFQINLPVFDMALSRISEFSKFDDIIDMYAGVGSIGLSVAQKSVELIESHPASAAMARLNAASRNDIKAKITEATDANTIQSIVRDKFVIFDPPRAGLHARVIERLKEVKPKRVVYLSCNPATQARDLKLLDDIYKIEFFEIYNFFPRTPHIETLAVLERRS